MEKTLGVLKSSGFVIADRVNKIQWKGLSLGRLKSLKAVLAIIFLILLLPAMSFAAPIGRVASIEGDVDVTAAGEMKPLKVNDPVSIGDIVRSKAKSKAHIIFNDGNEISIAENTRFEVTQYDNEPKGKSFFNLFRGKVRTVLGNLSRDASFEIHTSTAVCGVRGTIFIGFFQNGQSGFVFEQGQGYGYNPGRPARVVTIQAGQAMTVSGADQDPVVRPATASEIQQHVQDTSTSSGDEGGEGSSDSGDQGEGSSSEGQESGDSGDTGDTGGTSSEGDDSSDSGDQGDGSSTEGQDSGDTGGTGSGDTGGTTSGGSDTGDTGGTTSGGGTTDDGGWTSSFVQDPTPPPTSTPDTPPPTTTPPPPPPPPPTDPEPPSPPPPPPPPPAETFTTFTQPFTLGDLTGTLSASVSDTTNEGTLSLTGTGTATTGITEITEGTMSDGSTYDGYLAGIPGSWRGLFTSIYRDGSSIGLLNSNDLDDAAYAGGSLSASGTLTRTGLASTNETAPRIFEDIPVPVFGSYGEGMEETVEYGKVKGYETTTGGILGVWGVLTESGSYTSIGTEWSGLFGRYEDYTYAFLGKFTGGDDGRTDGHTWLSATDSIHYMDSDYLGLLSFEYRGYQSSSIYSSVGTGTYTLAPLAFSGHWGGEQGGLMPTCLFFNNGGDYTLAGYDPGILGGLDPFWSGIDTSFLAMGTYDLLQNTSLTHYLWNTPVYGSQNSSDSPAWFSGYTAGLWVPDGSTTNNMLYAVYADTSGAGLLISKVGKDEDEGIEYFGITMDTYASLNMWKAEGTLEPIPLGGPAADTYDFRMGYMEGTFAGAFTDDTASSITGDTTEEIHTSETMFLTDGSQSLPWGIYNLRLGSDNTFSGKPDVIPSDDNPYGDTSWSAHLGGMGQFGYDDHGYWLMMVADGTWNYWGEVSGTAEGTYLTDSHLGYIGGPFTAVNVAPSGSFGTWIGQSVGTYQGTTPTDFGGDWYNCLLYNDDGWMEWDCGEGEGAFGFAKRDDKETFKENYDFLAIGKFEDYGSGMEDFGGPYLWSGHLSDERGIENRYLEAFTGGIWKKADPGDYSGTMAGTAAALYFTGDNEAGLIWGDITGDFYDMRKYYDGDLYEIDGMWQVQSGDSGLDKTIYEGLPEDFADGNPSIESSDIYASLAGTFGGSGEIFGEYYSGCTRFITYDVYDSQDNWIATKSLPFGIYNLKLGYGYEYNYYLGKPADEGIGTGVEWSARIGWDGYFGYTDYGYWLAGIDGTWDEYSNSTEDVHGTITGELAGQYVSYYQMGSIGGPFYGLYTEGEPTDSGTWAGESIGSYRGTPTDFGGYWENCLLYNNDGSMEWDWDGEWDWGGGYGAFGFVARSSDENYDFLAIGEFEDYGSGMEGYGGPYLWSGNLRDEKGIEARYLEAFTGGIWKKDDWEDSFGTMAGNIVSLYFTGGNEAGLIWGDLTGNFYDMYYDDYRSGMWQVQSGDSGLEKTIYEGLPDFNAGTAGIESDEIYASLGGSFGGSGEIFGEYYNGCTRFITYYSSDDEMTKSLPFGIYNLKMGGDVDDDPPVPATYWGKPADTGTGVGWNAKIGGDGYFGYSYNNDYGDNYHYGYWLAGIDGTWDEYSNSTEDVHGTINGELAGTYLTLTHTGSIGGPYYGLYTEGEVANSGTWVGESIGYYESTPLAYSGYWGLEGESLYYNNAGSFAWAGEDYGIIGLTEAVPESEYDLIAMGEFYIESDSPSYLWNSYITPSEITGESSSVGGFGGFSGGIAKNESMSGSIAALFARQYENEGETYLEAGLLTGPVEGNIFTEIGMWEATGGLKLSILEENVSYSETSDFYPDSGYLGGIVLSGNFDGNGDIIAAYGGGITAFYILDGTSYQWGIYEMDVWGDATYSGKPQVSSTAWNSTISGKGKFGSDDYDNYGYFLADIGGKKWTEYSADAGHGTINGDLTGIYLTATDTGRIGGAFYGIYTDGEVANSGTWIGESIGTYEWVPPTSGGIITYATQTLTDPSINLPIEYDSNPRILLATSLETTDAWITADPTRGIGRTLMSGTHNIGAVSTDNFSDFSWTLNLPATEDTEVTEYWESANLNGNYSTGSEGDFQGSLAGAKVDWISATTAVLGGEIKGLFDPNNTDWQAVALSSWIEANKFLSMAATESGRSVLETLNIPCFAVGSTDLRGSGSGIDLGSAADPSKGILNATFFASSTGGQPNIWASGMVNGGYGTPTGDPVNLSGYVPGAGTSGSPAETNGITANFNMQHFDTAGGKWAATVTNGSAPANSLTFSPGVTAHPAIDFRGAAAGTVDTGNATFSGTAAGVAK